ncbi:hypothetical protein [Paraburkholderia sp. BL10I2N1]|uniref:hypothetical protein n=1 Tax=Paraburkholderia sp. BL10I2N1 TaxID=1938796 RepID=UPI00106190D3|nr:hypothetical protein [Paraburkholderia sp. BL10I2N1]
MKQYLPLFQIAPAFHRYNRTLPVAYEIYRCQFDYFKIGINITLVFRASDFSSTPVAFALPNIQNIDHEAKARQGRGVSGMLVGSRLKFMDAESQHKVRHAHFILTQIEPPKPSNKISTRASASNDSG